MGFSKVLLSRTPCTVNTTRKLALYCWRRETPKKAHADIQSRIYEFPHSEANALLLSVAQPTRALHQTVCNSPSLVYWEKRLHDYQTMWKRYWRKAHQLRKEGSVDASQTREFVELEWGFNKLTRSLLRRLGLLPISDNEELENYRRGIHHPVFLPPIIASNVFNALNDATDLCSLDVRLPTLVELLEKRYCSYNTVQKLVNFPLLPKALPSQGTIAETLATYRVLTAYLFYTAFTPKDIHGVLSDISVLENGGGRMAKVVGGEVILIKEYFCFLRLYLEMCETDDDLRGTGDLLVHSRHHSRLEKELVGDEAVEERLFNRQSRRILLGRLDGWIKFYHSTGGKPLVPFSGKGRVGALAMGKHGLTEEQEKIVQLDLSVGDFLRVKAFAGTGKTKVLVQYAKARPQKRILFLAFNVSVQQDAEKKFSSNVECRTFHSLARQVVLNMQPGLEHLETRDDNLIYEIIRILGLDEKTIREALNESSLGSKKCLPSAASVARVINETLISFFSSAEAEIDYNSFHWMMAHKLGLRTDIILEWTRRIWDRMKNGEVPHLPIGAYPKILHLYGLEAARVKGRLERCEADKLAFGSYDMIMFDEAQDADPVMAEIILRQRPFMEVIIVGDPYQMIYEFRGTNNECFDDNLYPATYNMSLTHSFRFGLGIAGAASPLLRALGDPTSLSAIGEMDVLRINFPEGTDKDPPALTVVEALPPGQTEDGRSGKYTKIFRSNRTLILNMFSYCRSHQNHKFRLEMAKPFQPNVLFPLLKAACELLRGKVAKSGPLKGIRSMGGLMGRTKAGLPGKSYAQRIYKSLSKAADKEPGVDTEKKAILKKAICQIDIDRELETPSSIDHELKSQILDALKCDLGPKLKDFFQAFLSKRLKPQLSSVELGLISKLYRENLISRPDFPKMIESCRQRVVATKDREAADITFTTAHQAKGLEWPNVLVTDEFKIPYIHRHDNETTRTSLEEIRIQYVAATRAQKELHIGGGMTHLLAGEWGSYRFFLSQIQGECPLCQGHRRQDTNDGIRPNPVETHGQLIGYEAVLPTGCPGSKLVRNQMGQWPFGDRADVIGCHQCAEGLYRAALCSWVQGGEEDKTILELGRFASGVGQAVDRGPATASTANAFPCGPMRERKGLLEVFEEINIAEEERVSTWTRNHMVYSWGVSLEK